MTLTGVSGAALASAYSMRIEKMAQSQQKLEGRQAVELIKQAGAAAPPSIDGKGTVIDTYA